MSNTIEDLEIQIKTNSTSAASGIDVLSTSLSKLKSTIKGGIGLQNIATEICGISNGTRALDSLVTSLLKFESAGKIKISANIGNQLHNIGSAISSLQKTDFTKITDLSQSLQLFDNIKDTKGLKSVVKELKQLPTVAKELATVNWAEFKTQMASLAVSLKPLANEIDKIGSGFKSLPTKIHRLANVSTKLTQTNELMGGSYINLWAKISMAIRSVKTGAKVIGSWITKSNEYIENLNLFHASMGQYGKDAQNYAEKAGTLLGLNPGEFMRNQGVFMTITEGFGVASERAYTMSKNLTQLGYDLSSFFNISFEDSMQKLQSGISGELEPLRRLGYDLSQAKLQAIALSLGIDKAFTSMTQAEKAQLRYYAIMTQVTTAQGDMARTLDAPANQLRILKAQITLTAQALGNIFLPILQKVLPIAIAAFKVIKTIADIIAKLFHFNLPDIDYGSIKKSGASVGKLANNAGDAKKRLGGAAKKAKELKNALLGIDELNIISPIDSADGGGNGGNGIGDIGGGGDFNFPLPEYNFLEGVKNKVDDIVKKMKKWLGLTDGISSWSELMNTRLGSIIKFVGSIAAGIAAWKLSKGFLNGLLFLKNFIDKGLGAPLMIAIGLNLFIQGAIFEWSGIKDAIKNELNKMNFPQIVLGGFEHILGGSIFGAGIAKLVTKLFPKGAIAKALSAAGENLGGMSATAAGGALFAAFAAIIAGIPMYFLGIKDAIKEKLNWLNGTLISLGSTLAGAGVGAIIGAMGGPIGAGIGALIGLIIGLLTDAVILVKQHWAEISSSFSNFFNVTIPNIWNNFKNKIKNMPETIRMFFDKMLEPIRNINWYDLGKQIGIKVGEMIKDIFHKAQELWDSFKNFFSQTLPSFFNETLPSFFNETLPAFFKDLLEKIKNFPKQLWEAAKAEWEWIKGIGKAIIDGIVDSFKELKNAAHKFVKGFLSGIMEGLGIDTSSAKEFITIAKDCIAGLFEGLNNGVKDLRKWTHEHVLDPIKNTIAKNPIPKIIVNLANTAKEWWEKARNWWSNISYRGVNMKAYVALAKRKWDNVKNWVEKFMKGDVSQKIALGKERWKTVTQWVRDQINGTVRVGIELFKNWTGSAKEKIKGWLGLSTGGRISANGTYYAFSNGGRINSNGTMGWWESIPKYASGTANAHGTMFVAGEAGAEVVGHINGNTEVLNKSQLAAIMHSSIVKGMYQFTGYWRNLNRQMAICTNTLINSFVINTNLLKMALSENQCRDTYSNLSQFVYKDNQDAYKQSYSDENLIGAIQTLYKNNVESTLNKIATDVKRQANKDEKTIIKIDGKTIAETVKQQQRTDGYNFIG